MNKKREKRFGKWLCGVLCCVMLSGMLAGCGQEQKSGEEQEQTSSQEREQTPSQEKELVYAGESLV